MSYALLSNADVGTQYRGMVVRRGSAGTCLLAQADSVPNATDVLGVRLINVAPAASAHVAGFSGGVVVRLDGAAADGDLIYLSAAVAGVGTNVAPPIALLLGYAYHTFSALGVWYAELIALPISLPGSGTPTANWAGCRYIFLDGDGGDDSHVGYIDAPAGTVFSLAQAAAVAVKTTHRINEVRPPVGAGRQVVVLIKPRAAGAKYDAVTPGDGLGSEDRSNCSGYSLMLTRGSDLTNSAADLRTMGFGEGVLGPNPDNSFTVLSVTSPFYNGGIEIVFAAGILPAAAALPRYRLRILSGAVTTYAPIKWGFAATPSVVAWTTPATVNPGDKVWIEEPTVCLDTFYEASDCTSGGALRTYAVKTATRFRVGTVVGGPTSSYAYCHAAPVGGLGGGFTTTPGAGSISIGQPVVDYDGSVLIEYPYGAYGWIPSTIGGIGTEYVNINYSSFSDATPLGGPPGLVVTGRRVVVTQSSTQALLVAGGVNGCVLEDLVTGPVLFNTVGHASVKYVRFADDWNVGPTGLYLCPGFTYTLPSSEYSSMQETADSRVTLEFSTNSRYLDPVEHVAAGYALSPGAYTVKLDMNNSSPGTYLDLRFDTSAPAKKVIVTYASLGTTGFEVENGQRLLCSTVATNFPGDQLLCPRGIVMQCEPLGGGSGPPSTGVGRVVMAASDRTKFTYAWWNPTTMAAGGYTFFGVTLTSMERSAGSADSDYAVVGQSGFMMVEKDATSANPQGGDLVYLCPAGFGTFSVTAPDLGAYSSAVITIGRALPAGPGAAGNYAAVAWQLTIQDSSWILPGNTAANNTTAWIALHTFDVKEGQQFDLEALICFTCPSDGGIQFRLSFSGSVSRYYQVMELYSTTPVPALVQCVQRNASAGLSDNVLSATGMTAGYMRIRASFRPGAATSAVMEFTQSVAKASDTTIYASSFVKISPNLNA